jgi:hypothetical protein
MGGAVFALRDTRHQLELPLYALHCTDDHITPYQVRLAAMAGSGWAQQSVSLYCRAAIHGFTTRCRLGQASVVRSRHWTLLVNSRCCRRALLQAMANLSVPFMMDAAQPTCHTRCSWQQLPTTAAVMTHPAVPFLQDMVTFVEATGTAAGDKVLRTVQGGYHDIWGGKDTQQYVQEAAAWVLQRAAAAAKQGVPKVKVQAS